MPDGWLIEPNNKWLLFFHKDTLPIKSITRIYIDKWEVSSTGTPLRFINRRKVELEPALETWNELINNGWLIVKQQLDQTA